jgi:hypothetical protein
LFETIKNLHSQLKKSIIPKRLLMMENRRIEEKIEFDKIVVIKDDELKYYENTFPSSING